MKSEVLMKETGIPVPIGLAARKIFVFLAFYSIFFLYLRLIVGTNQELMYFVNSLILVIFIISVYRIKWGLYLFVFLLPLLNSSANFLVGRPRYIVVFMFFGLFLGFLVNHSNRYLAEYPDNGQEKFIFDRTVMKIILVFTILLAVSCAVTIYRYSNFIPFITGEYHNLDINLDGVRSSNSMVWTLRFFYNYFIGFLFFFLIFNVIRKLKDILACLISIIAATMVSATVILYQYFVNPVMGNAQHWADSGRFNATFTDPNALGGYTILLFPIFAGMILYYKKWYLKVLFSITFVFFLLLLLFSGSRSAFISIALAIFIFAIIFIARGINRLRKRSASWRSRRKTAIILSISIIAIIILMVIVLLIVFAEDLLGGFGLVERTIETFRTGIYYFSKYGIMEGLKSISNYRYIFWGQAVEMVRDYPVSGVGQGAYILQLPNYLVMHRTGFDNVDYAGNYYLQVLAELGFPGFVLVIALFFVLFKRALSYFLARRKAACSRDESGIPVTGETDRYDWIMRSLYIAYAAMLAGQIFGPHTNFNEIQLTFWFVTGLMMAFIKVRQKNKDVSGILEIRERLAFTMREKVSSIMILVIFTGVFFFNSFTGLSINVSQNLYDIKGNYKGWQNDYGIYNEEISQEGPFKWIAPEASTVLEKKGGKLIIPLKDAHPDKQDEELSVRLYINNTLVKRAYLDYNKWESVEVDIPGDTRDHFTLTIVFNRGWSPKELGLNSDTRVFGGQVRNFEFAD